MKLSCTGVAIITAACSVIATLVIDNIIWPKLVPEYGKLQINTFPASGFIKVGDDSIPSGQLLEDLAPGEYTLTICDEKENVIVEPSVIVRPGEKKELGFCLIPRPDPDLDPNLADNDIIGVHIPKQSRKALETEGYKFGDFTSDDLGDIKYYAKALLNKNFVDFIKITETVSWEGSIDVGPGETKQLPINLLFPAVELSFVLRGNNYPVILFYVPKRFSKCVDAIEPYSFKGVTETFHPDTFSIKGGIVTLPSQKQKDFSPDLIPVINVLVKSGEPLDIFGSPIESRRGYYAPRVIESDTKGVYRLEVVVYPEFAVRISPAEAPLPSLVLLGMVKAFPQLHPLSRVSIDYLDIVVIPAELSPLPVSPFDIEK